VQRYLSAKQDVRLSVKYLDANRVNLKADSFTAGLLALKKKSLAKSGFSNLARNLASVILREIWLQ